MFAIIGYAIVFGSVLGGFVIEGGAVGILVQPVEFLIICGAALGALIIGTPIKTIKAMIASIMNAIMNNGYSKADYMQLFAMMFEMFSVMRKSGEMAMEKDVDDPANSEIFKKYPKFMANHSTPACAGANVLTLSCQLSSGKSPFIPKCRLPKFMSK